MIINPLAAAAAVASRAIRTILPSVPTPTTQYFVDIEENLNDQSRELEDYMLFQPVNVKDAEILSKESANTASTSGPSGSKPPPLPDTNNPWILLGLDQGINDFATIRAAYKQKAKVYHPDVVVGPDATPDERTDANWDFARINAAFDILKRKEEEEVFEYEVYVDGNRETRCVSVPSSSDNDRDPYHINYERIIENRKRYPHAKMRSWYEQDRYDEPNHSYRKPRRYDPEPYAVDASTAGKWWIARDYHMYDHVEYARVGDPIPSREKMWDARHVIAGDEVKIRRGSGAGFGAVNPHEGKWWDDRSAFESTWNGNNNYANHQAYSHVPRDDITNGYPYKDMHWNDRIGFDESSPYQPTNGPVGYEYDPQNEQHFAEREKWWKGDETVTGEFSP